MTALRLYRTTVRPEMIDYNGHLTEGWYVLIFGEASDAFYEHLGAGAAWRAARKRSLYTLEAHVRYLREVPEGAELTVATRLVGHDGKRLHLAHELERDGAVVATEEVLALCVDTEAGRAALFEPELTARLAALCSAPPPDYCGRRVALPGSPPA